MRTKRHIHIPDNVRKIREAFRPSGYSIFLVGGCVRDVMLNRQPKDYDLATDATPAEVLEILDDFHIVPVGESFGVVRVIFPEGDVEIATFREDIGEGRRPESVQFTTIEGDVKRRDFTINALFYDLETEEVVDLVGGLDDLRDGILRCVGNAEDRMREDPLRKLRAVRFMTKLKLEMDSDLVDCITKSPSLQGVSGERIRAEFLNILAGATSQRDAIQVLSDLGMLQHVLPGFSTTLFVDGDHNYDPLIFIAAVIINTDIAWARKMLQKLTFTREEIRAITWLLAFARMSVKEGVPQEAFILKRNQELSEKEVREFLMASGRGTHLASAFLRWNLSISGDDLLQEGFTGKELGLVMEARELAILEQHLTQTA